MFTTRHSADGRSSYTYSSNYDFVWWIAKLFALLCVPMLLGVLSIHNPWHSNLALLALATPGLVVSFIWGRGLLRGVAFLARYVRFRWRALRPSRGQQVNVLRFPKGGR